VSRRHIAGSPVSRHLQHHLATKVAAVMWSNFLDVKEISHRGSMTHGITLAPTWDGHVRRASAAYGKGDDAPLSHRTRIVERTVEQGVVSVVFEPR
jgi:hypothetical protein